MIINTARKKAVELERAESVKCLLYKHEDPSSVSKTNIKKLGIGLCL